MNNKEKFVRFLLESGALTFGDFTLKSGRKSPYMINTGKLDSGIALSRLGCFYAKTIYEKMQLGIIPDDVSILFGSAYKGIPLAASASIALAAAFDINLGYAFNRKEAKDHGEGGVFVGKKPGPGDKILIIDDVMTAGTALRDVVELLSEGAPEARVVGSIIAVDRKEFGLNKKLSAVAEAQYQLGFPIIPIIDIDEIVNALKSGGIAAEDPEESEDRSACSVTLDFFGRDFEKITTALPTEEQIAAIEKYLEEYRPVPPGAGK